MCLGQKKTNAKDDTTTMDLRMSATDHSISLLTNAGSTVFIMVLVQIQLLSDIPKFRRCLLPAPLLSIKAWISWTLNMEEEGALKHP